MRLTAKKVIQNGFAQKIWEKNWKNIEIYGMKSANWNTGIVSKSISDG
jgi:hypothetical protein